MTEYPIHLRDLHAFGLKPERAPVARVAIFHGYGDHAGRYRELMRFLASCDIESAAMDFRGHGKSAGKRGYVRQWDEYLDDAAKLLDHLRGGAPSTQNEACPPGIRETGESDPSRDSPEGAPRDQKSIDPTPPLFILGHSHGGLIAAAGLTFGRFEHVRGAVLISPFLRNKASVSFRKRLLARFGHRFLPSLKVATGLDGSMMTHDESMHEDSRRDALLNRCATPRWFVTMQTTQRRVFDRADDLTTPYLALIGTDDVVADPAGMRHLHFRSRATDKTLEIHPGLRHELLRETGRAEIFASVARWILDRASFPAPPLAALPAAP